jgi:hypothetical protein
VEFGFVNGVLELLQIRPFLESRSARESVYLARLDAADADSKSKRVDMNGTPVQ